MTRQEKTVSIAILIPLVYGLIIWLETGVFALPFPLLDLLFFITSVTFALRLSKTYPYTMLFSVAFALTHLLAHPFIWSFFISEENIQEFSTNGTSDLLKLISGCFYIAWGTVSIYRGDERFRIFSFLAFLFSFIAALIFKSSELFLFTSLLPYFLSFKYRDIQPFHLLWLLLLLFEWIKWFMNFWIIE